MKTLGAYLVEALEALGVRHVFGIPGVHNLELYRGLAASRLRHVSGRHEQGLGFMADGYARASGRPGVCFTITGPGLSNIATAMAQAAGDSVPMLVVSSQNRRADQGGGRGFLHELADQAGLAARTGAATHVIGEPAALPAALEQAFAGFASGRGRPVYLEIPRDVLAMEAGTLPLPTVPAAVAPVAGAAGLADAALRLQAAERPVLLAGGGARHAGAALRALAEALEAPVVMTVNGRGLLPPGHPLAVPFSPSLEAVRALIAAADAVLAVGTELGPTDYDMYARSALPPPPGLIRVDIDALQLPRNAPPALALHGDSGAVLAALGARLAAGRRQGGGATRAATTRAAALAELDAPMQRQIGFLETIRDTVPGALLVGDSTQPVYAGNLGFAAAAPGTWFNSSTGYGTLGYALPAATGAGLGAPDRPVVCLVGDGGLQFTLGELAVPREVDAWLAIVVWNNGGYGEIRSSMVAAGLAPAGVDVRAPDIATLAAAYGYAQRRIGSLEELGAALGEFAARRQVIVLEVLAEAFE